MSIQDPSQNETTPLEAAAALTPEPTVEGDDTSIGPVAVFSANSVDEGQIIRGLLESEGIPAIYDAQAGIMMADSVARGDTPTGVVLVSIDDEARARELIAAYSVPLSDEELSDAADASGG